MEAVTLTRGGTLLLGSTEATDALGCLGNMLKLQEGVSLRSFITMLQTYPDIQRLNPFLKEACTNMTACKESGCRTDDFSHLELYRQLEMTGAPGTPEMNIHTMLRGIGGQQRHELRFYRLENLLDLPFTLGQMRHVIFGDRTSELYCQTTFSLFEVIEGIAWELGFQGGSLTCSLRR